MLRRATKSSAKKTSRESSAQSVAQRLAGIGLRADWDFALHLPIRYEDETRITRVRDALTGIDCQVEVVVTHNEVTYRPRRQLVVTTRDGEDTLFLRFLNFYGSQAKQMAVGKRLRLFGEVRQGFFGSEMVHPRVRVVSEGEPVPDTLTPVYSTTAGVSQLAIRRFIDRALANLDHADDFDDCIPEPIRRAQRLQDFRDALVSLHRPTPSASLHALAERSDPAWRRIKFDELLAQQLAMKQARAARDAKSAPAMRGDTKLEHALSDALPFELTGAQQRAAKEITNDLSRTHPMQRLLQGDVGAGKTIVAALAAARAIGNHFQVALMAPTEILAEQHYRKLKDLLAPLGVTVTWLTGSLKAKEKREAIAAIADGTTQFAIGTHALFQEGVAFANLGLAIIDEQHRFGVGQRLALREKAAVVEEAHQLMMSATPIPRTLSMTYFADLDVSVIDELPPGRTPVLTRLLADERRDELLARIRAACLAGGQAYWVCPLIEESEKLQLQTAVDTFARIQAEFPDLRVGLVHGRLKPAEKNAVMAEFVAGRIELLVATTVIEVGVDVPNASIMVIEHAERFGLSQLHQLRGRVGRGAKQSACMLLYQSPLGQVARARLKVIVETTDGFEVARQDLLLRGPGEHLGARQSGAPLLRFADIERDVELVEAARDAAEWLLAHDRCRANRHLARWLGSRQHYLKA
jgi:ATP-dependent DNA helicase RecG